MKILDRRVSVILALALSGVLALSMLALIVYSTIELKRFEHVDNRRAVVVYASGQTLFRGVNVRMIDLAGTLGRLGYVETHGSAPGRGQFRRTGGSWEISLRDGGGRIGLELQGERIARVSRDGRAAESAVLEGEVLTGGRDQPGEDYRPIRLASVPKVLVDAVLAAELLQPQLAVPVIR